jgi:hypothetical protein
MDLKKIWNYEWKFEYPWGNYSSSIPYQRAHKDAFSIKDNDVYLNVVSSEHPKVSTDFGILCSVFGFNYGTFEADIKMPQGKNLWPSFWLFGGISFPPKIDIMVGASGESGGYWNKYKPYSQISSNLHYGEYLRGEHFTLGSKNHYMGVNFTEEFVNYKLVWKKDFIGIYYNDILHRKVDDKKILKYFSQPMQVVMNSGVSSNDNQQETPMIISNFKYTPIEN